MSINDTKKVDSANKRSNYVYYVYTILIGLTNIATAISYSTFGPSFVDLKHILNTSMSDISIITTFDNIGYVLGALSCIMYKYLNRQITLPIILCCMGVAGILTPYSQSLWQLYICVWMHGFGDGNKHNSFHVWLIEMWQEKSTIFLQLSGFIYGIGLILGPLIVSSYLTGEIYSNVSYISSNNNSAVHYDISNTTEYFNEPNISNTSDSSNTSLIYNTNDLYNESYILNTTDLSNATYLLSTTDISNKNTTINLNQTIISDFNNNERRNKLKIPFRINGVMLMLLPSLLFIMYFIKKYKTPPKLTNTENKQPIKKHFNSDDKYNRNLFIILISIFGAFFVGSETILLQLSPTFYQFISLKLTASKAAELASASALAYTCGRGFSAFSATKLKPQYIIGYHSLIIFAGINVLYFGQDSLTFLWIGSLLLGFGYSAVVPAMYGFIGVYLHLTNTIGGIIMCSSNVLNLILPYVLGFYIEKYPNSFIFMFALIFCMSLCTFSFILVLINKTKNSGVKNTQN